MADCNQAGGSYTLGEFEAVTITLGPTTLAVCPEDSRSDEFLELLGATTNYTFEGDQLLLLTPGGDLLGLLFDPVE